MKLISTFLFCLLVQLLSAQTSIPVPDVKQLDAKIRSIVLNELGKGLTFAEYLELMSTGDYVISLKNYPGSGGKGDVIRKVSGEEYKRLAALEDVRMQSGVLLMMTSTSISPPPGASVTPRPPGMMPSPPPEIQHSMQRSYQYNKLINTGEYSMRADGTPGLSGTKMYIIKQNEEGQVIKTEALNVVNSDAFKVNSPLDLKPLQKDLKDIQLNNKAVLLILQDNDCEVCGERFAQMNDYLKLVDPNEMTIILVTDAGKKKAEDQLKEYPIANVRLISNGFSIRNNYHAGAFPIYVIVDRNMVVRQLVSGPAPVTVGMVKGGVEKILAK